jgi:hypothetical protein
MLFRISSGRCMLFRILSGHRMLFGILSRHCMFLLIVCPYLLSTYSTHHCIFKRVFLICTAVVCTDAGSKKK